MRWMSWRRMALPKAYGGMGFRTLSEFNTVMLAKQGWRLLTDSDSLAARILKSKYFPRSEFLDATLNESGRPSATWRSIMSAQYLIRDGFRRVVESGTEISIWKDKWLPSFPYSISTPWSEGEELRMVSELIDAETHTWNRELIEAHFNSEDIYRILSIPLSGVGVDGWAWIHNTHGRYTVKSGHHRAMTLWRMENGLTVNVSSTPWKYIWSARLPEKVKIWLWKACHGALAVKQRLLDRNVNVDVTCPVCQGDIETVMHLVTGCTFAKAVFQASPLGDRVFQLQGQQYGDILSEIGQS